MGKRRLVICPVTSFRVLTISNARARGIIKVIEIGGLGSSSSRRSLINLAIKFTGSTSANEAGGEEEDKNEGDNTNDREDSSNRACVMEETGTIVSRSPEEYSEKRDSCGTTCFHGFAADAPEERGRFLPAGIAYHPKVGTRETSRSHFGRDRTQKSH